MRQCGSCTLCCTLVRVEELGKAQYTRCTHQSRSRGCKIYAARPEGCRQWFCCWRLNLLPLGCKRPDHSGYLVDCLPDWLSLEDGEHTVKHPAIYISNAPGKPLAHRDPHLLSWLMHEWHTRSALGVVHTSKNGPTLTLMPPGTLDPHAFVEHPTKMGVKHDLLDRMRFDVPYTKELVYKLRDAYEAKSQASTLKPGCESPSHFLAQTARNSG
jgi:hypothetical protein